MIKLLIKKIILYILTIKLKLAQQERFLCVHNQVIVKYVEIQKDICTCTKAFDGVKHDKLIKYLKEISLVGKDTQILTNL